MSERGGHAILGDVRAEVERVRLAAARANAVAAHEATEIVTVPDRAPSPLSTRHLKILHAVLREAIEHARADARPALVDVQTRVGQMIGGALCGHCGVTEAVGTRRLCDLCSGYERKMGRLPDAALLRKRIRTGDGRRSC